MTLLDSYFGLLDISPEYCWCLIAERSFQCHQMSFIVLIMNYSIIYPLNYSCLSLRSDLELRSYRHVLKEKPHALNP